MSVYQESGLTVDLTGLSHHRFQDLPAYKKLSGLHLKEMDFFWLQDKATSSIAANTLIGFELKGYDQTALDVAALLENLLQKAKDSMAMLQAAWLDMGDGAHLKSQLPAAYRFYNSARPVSLIMLVHINPAQTAQLSALRTQFKNKIAGFERLYGMKTSLVNLSVAQRMGLPVN
jgi:hypothetical protein